MNDPKAFPLFLHYQREDKATVTCINEGMTLRDYFAAKASDEDIAEIVGQERGMNEPAITRAAARFIHADAMLIESAKGQP